MTEKLSLLLHDPEGRQQRVVLQPRAEVKIGRSAHGNDVVLPSAKVSKRHARVVCRDGRILVVDLKSTNGTYVNGRRITSPLAVGVGDRIDIGEFVARVDVATRPPPIPKAPTPMPRVRPLAPGDPGTGTSATSAPRGPASAPEPEAGLPASEAEQSPPPWDEAPASSALPPPGVLLQATAKNGADEEVHADSRPAPGHPDRSARSDPLWAELVVAAVGAGESAHDAIALADTILAARTR